MDGALLVDKPPGPTSHDIVAIVRRTLHTPRVGHTGTLDPLATGLLVLLVGQATRCAQFLVADEKEYIADVRLGLATATYDAQGLEGQRARSAARGVSSEARRATFETRDVLPGGTADQIDAVLQQFRGTFLQVPPPYSAKKIEGVPAYKKARKNEPIALTPVEVTVRVLDMLPVDDADTLLRLRLVVTSGFYVRSLAHDIGQRLGCGAHLEALRRTRAGRFDVADAITLAQLDAEGAMSQTRLLPLNVLLAHMPAVTLTDEGIRRVSHGNSLGPAHVAGAPAAPEGAPHVRLLDDAASLLAVAERRPDGLLHPVLVLR